MNTYDSILRIIDVNLIYCLIPALLILFFIEKIFKNRFPTRKVLNVIRYIIISYSIITLTHFLFLAFFSNEKTAIMNRSNGPYAIFYWILFITTTALPFSLFIKKLGTKYWYMILVAFSLKIGVFYEYFVILTTSFHRDYGTENYNENFLNSVLIGISLLFLQSFIFIIIGLCSFSFYNRIKPQKVKSFL